MPHRRIDPYATTICYGGELHPLDTECHAQSLERCLELDPGEASRLSWLGAVTLQIDAWQLALENMRPSRTIVEAVEIRTRGIHKARPDLSMLSIMGAVATGYDTMFEIIERQKQNLHNGEPGEDATTTRPNT